MINIKQNKGITLITLMIAILLMLIISSVIIYNAESGVNIRELNNMYSDITILKEKVDIYYSQYGTLPIIETLYTNVRNLKNINVNDNKNYYVVDIESLENVTLKYGKDYASYKTFPDDSKTDLYVINEQSHTVYYVQGIELDGITYHTTVSDYTKVDIYSINVNPPQLDEGMIPIKWNGAEIVETTSYDVEWYDYIDTSIERQTSTSKWANARTEDGSMWVWIPRYAYKITYTDSNDKSKGGTIDVVFLKGTTNEDFNGNDVTLDTYVDENGTIGKYIVHPSFKDGRENGFVNGEWDSEITGFWMAKFEAGYAGTAGNPTTASDSSIPYSVIYTYNGNSVANLDAIYYGNRTKDLTAIKYPVFQGNRPSMNYVGISDAYDLCLSLSTIDNPYGFTNKVDSHLTKNSEWGAVAFLTHSKYGRNGEEVSINNVSANGTNTIYAVTGYSAATKDQEEDTSRTLTTLLSNNQTGSWTTSQGQLASSTGNIYGIYDLNGGVWEWTASYVATTGNYETYGGNLKGDSTKYKSKYAGTNATDTVNYNENVNKTRLGEAIWETSSSGTGSTSWESGYSNFINISNPFFMRGGTFINASKSGIFAFHCNPGFCNFHIGFRSVLVIE